MAPIATSPPRRASPPIVTPKAARPGQNNTSGNKLLSPEEASIDGDLKGTEGKKSLFQAFNPYHNPGADDIQELDSNEARYAHEGLKPSFPKDLVYEPYEPIYDVQDRGLFAEKSKANLLSACSKVTDLNVHIGTELEGIQVKQLSDAQKDELALLVAERGVVVLRDQDLTGEEFRNWGRYFGPQQRPLHQHSSSGVPKQRGLDELHVVWHDEKMRPTDTSYT